MQRSGSVPYAFHANLTVHQLLLLHLHARSFRPKRMIYVTIALDFDVLASNSPCPAPAVQVTASMRRVLVTPASGA